MPPAEDGAPAARGGPRGALRRLRSCRRRLRALLGEEGLDDLGAEARRIPHAPRTRVAVAAPYLSPFLRRSLVSLHGLCEHLALRGRL
eukprot:3772242-Alexandrium_andersonii.AAC.1